MASLEDATFGKYGQNPSTVFGKSKTTAQLTLDAEMVRSAQNNALQKGWRSAGLGLETGELDQQADIAALQGDLQGAATLRQQARLREAQAQVAQGPQSPEFTDFATGQANLSQAPTWAAQTMGSAARTFAAPVAGAVGGAVLGGVAGIPAGPVGVVTGAALGARAGSFIPSAIMESQGVASEMANDAKIMANYSAGERLAGQAGMGVASGALESLVPGGIVSGAAKKILAKEAGAAATKYALKDAATDVLKTAGKEGLTEAGQKQIVDTGMYGMNTDRELIDPKGLINEAAAGAVGGGGIALPGAAMKMVKNRKEGGTTDSRTMLDRVADGVADAGATVGKVGGKVINKAETLLDKARANQDDEHLGRVIADAPAYDKDMPDAEVVAKADADLNERLVAAGNYANKVRSNPKGYRPEELDHAEQYVQSLERGIDPETAMNLYREQLKETKRGKKVAKAFEGFTSTAKANKQRTHERADGTKITTAIPDAPVEGNTVGNGLGITAPNTQQDGAAKATPVTKESNKAALQAKRDLDLQTWNDTLALVHKTLSSDKKSRLRDTAQRDDVRNGILGLGQWVKQGFQIEDEDGNMRVGVPDKFIEELGEDAPRVVKLTIDTLKEQGLIDAETSKLGEKMIKLITKKEGANRGTLSAVMESFTLVGREELGKELPRMAQLVREQLRLVAKNKAKLSPEDDAALSRWFGINKAKLLRGFKGAQQKLDKKFVEEGSGEQFENVTGEELAANPDMQEENEFSTKLASHESVWRESELFDGEAKTEYIGSFDTRQPGTRAELDGKLKNDFSKAKYPNSNVQEIGIVEALEYKHADDAAALDAALQGLREKYDGMKLSDINKAVRTIQLSSLTENDKSVVKGEEFANLQPGQPNNKWAVSAGKKGEFGTAAHGMLVFERVAEDGETTNFNTSTTKLVQRGRKLDSTDGRTSKEASSDIIKALSSGITSLFESKMENGRFALSGRIGYRKKAGGPVTWLDLATEARTHDGDTSEYGDVRSREDRMVTAKEQGDSTRTEARNQMGVGIGSKSGKLKTLGDKAFAQSLLNGMPGDLRLPSGVTLTQFREEAGRDTRFDKPWTEAFDFNQLKELSRKGLVELRSARVFARAYVMSGKLDEKITGKAKEEIIKAITRQINAIDEALKGLPAYRGKDGQLTDQGDSTEGTGSTFNSSEWRPEFTDQNGNVLTTARAFELFELTPNEPSKSVGKKADKLVTHLVMVRNDGEESIARTPDGKAVARSTNTVEPVDRGVGTGTTESGKVRVGAPRSQYASTDEQRSERANSLPATEFEPKAGTRIKNERPEGERNADQLPDGSPEPQRNVTLTAKIMDLLRVGIPAFTSWVKTLDDGKLKEVRATLIQMGKSANPQKGSFVVVHREEVDDDYGQPTMREVRTNHDTEIEAKAAVTNSRAEFGAEIETYGPSNSFWHGKPPADVRGFLKRARAALTSLDAVAAAKKENKPEEKPAFKPKKVSAEEKAAREDKLAAETNAGLSTRDGGDIDISSQLVESTYTGRQVDSILLDEKGWPNTVAEAFAFIKAMKTRYVELKAKSKQLGDDFLEKHEAEYSALEVLNDWINPRGFSAPDVQMLLTETDEWQAMSEAEGLKVSQEFGAAWRELTKGGKANKQAKTGRKISEAEQNKIRKEMAKVLGPEFAKALEFLKLVKVGGTPVSGKWEKELIQIAINALDPTQVARHESIHQLFKWLADHGAANVKEVLENAASNPVIKNKLRRLLDGDTAAIAQLDNKEEAAAYLYQFWMTRDKDGKRLIELGPKTETFFEKITDLFKRFFNLLSAEVKDMEHADAILQAFSMGQLAEGKGITKLEKDLIAERTGGNKLANAFNNQKQLQKYVYTSIAALDDTKIPALMELRKKFFTKTGEALATIVGPSGVRKNLNYLDGKKQAMAEWMSRLDDIFKTVDPEDKEDMTLALKELHNETELNDIGDPVVRKLVEHVRNYLKDMYQYMQDNKIQRFNEKTNEWEDVPAYEHNYFPWVMDMDKLTTTEGGAEFVQTLLKEHPDQLDRIVEQANKEATTDEETNSLFASHNIKGRPITREDVAQAILARYISAGGAKEINESSSDLGITPYAASVNKRTLHWLNKAKFSQFTSQDLIQTLTGYTTQMVKRGEYTSRFGNGGQAIKDAVMDGYIHMLFNGDATKIAAADKAYSDAMKNWSKRKKAAAGSNDTQRKQFEEERPTRRGTAEALLDAATKDATIKDAMVNIQPVMDSIMAQEGTLGRDITPQTRSLVSGIMVYQTYRLMPLSLFAQFGDPIGMIVNGATMKEAWNAFTRGIRDVKRTYVKDKDQVSDVDEDIAVYTGTTDSHQYLDSLGQMYSSLYLHGKFSRLNNAMFKWNGQEAFNRALRIEANIAARRFFKQHLTQPDRNSERRLKEYGLTEGAQAYVAQQDIYSKNPDGTNKRLLVKKGGLDIDHPAVRAAMLKWVNDAILSPNSAIRPTAASDQHLAMFYHLKSFAYAFHKTTLRRAHIEAQNGNYNPAISLFLGYAPVMIAADAMKEMLVPGDEPPWMEGGLDDWLSHGFSRANLMGIPQFAYDANPVNAPWNWDTKGVFGDPAQSAGLLGPAVSQAVGAAITPLSDKHNVGDELINALPGAVIARRATKNWFDE